MRGFTAIPNSVIRDATIPASTRLLYGVILSYAWSTRLCSAKVETLCGDTGIGRSAFFEGIALLKERGLLEVQKRKSKNGWCNVYVPIAKGVEIPDAEEGRPDTGQGVVREADEGLSATRTQKKTKKEEEPSADASGTREQLPLDFPDELRPHARAVFKVLREVAMQHRAKAVTARALAPVIMARPRKPLVKAAFDLQSWAADRPRPIKDVVATYRNWLDNTHDLAALEPLPGEPSAPNGKVQRKAEAEAAQARRHAARRRLIEEARGA